MVCATHDFSDANMLMSMLHQGVRARTFLTDPESEKGRTTCACGATHGRY
jgi:hypothetical protein